MVTPLRGQKSSYWLHLIGSGGLFGCDWWIKQGRRQLAQELALEPLDAHKPVPILRRRDPTLTPIYHNNLNKDTITNNWQAAKSSAQNSTGRRGKMERDRSSLQEILLLSTRTGLMASLPASPRGCVFFRVTVGVTQRSTGTEEEIDKRGASNPRYSRGDVGISELN